MSYYGDITKVSETLKRGTTPFNEVTTVEFSPLIELDSANGLSALRDKQTTSNNATITSNSTGELKLSTSTTANGEAILDTAEKGRYQPGLEAIAGVAVRRPTAPTGNQEWEAGYFDDENGYWIGEDSQGLYVQRRVGGVNKTKVRKEDWNGDLESSDYINLTTQTVFRFPHLCYYEGPLRIETTIIDSVDNSSQTILLHSFGPDNNEPVLHQSKLPVRTRVSNGGDTNNLDIFVGGRHYGIRGRYAPNRRETAERRISLSTSTTLIPAISFRKKNNYSDKAKSIKVSGVAVLSDVNALVEIHLNPTLTGANYGAVNDVPAEETAVEVDTSATAITNGQVLDRTLVSGGQGNRSNFTGIRQLGLDIPDDAEITIAIRTISGTGTATLVFSVEEEW